MHISFLTILYRLKLPTLLEGILVDYATEIYDSIQRSQHAKE